MEYFTKQELIPCFREGGQDRCKDCRLMQAVTRMPNGIEENIEALVTEVLDPARRKLGKPVFVNSGFRCPNHNKYVGGVSQSQHIKGQAADIRCEDNKLLAQIIEENGCFDQLIIYGSFLHVSWTRSGQNRKQIINK